MPRKPLSGNIPTTPAGIKAMKLDDFKEIYKWQVDEFPLEKHKVIFTLPMSRYYELGVHCIENNVSIAQFIRNAVLAKLDYVNSEAFKDGKLF